ncbi:MAG: PDZ domain-containing protein [Bacilli bacterium]|nr:PDZ domain-containing protein [Bacilli bacterium]
MKFKKFIKREYKFILFIVIVIALFYIKLPYYISAPGGIIDVTDRVEMEGYENKKGSLNMLYVSEYDATPASYLWAKLSGYEISSNKEKQISNESSSDVETRNKIMRDNSLDIATMVAYTKANKKIDVKNKKNIVIATTSDNGLEIGDIILEANETVCEEVEDIKNIIKTKKVGDIINFKILRDNKEIEVQSEILLEDNSKVIGVIIVTEYDYELEPEIDIKFRNSESGASGGLMLTLTIYNAISGEDIIKGRNISGTGTISSDGSVGEIDGVKYKIMGAARNNMDIAFVPSNNYDEAIATKEKYNYDIEIVKVDTFDEAIEYLKNN